MKRDGEPSGGSTSYAPTPLEVRQRLTGNKGDDPGVAEPSPTPWYMKNTDGSPASDPWEQPGNSGSPLTNYGTRHGRFNEPKDDSPSTEVLPAIDATTHEPQGDFEAPPETASDNEPQVGTVEYEDALLLGSKYAVRRLAHDTATEVVRGKELTVAHVKNLVESPKLRVAEMRRTIAKRGLFRGLNKRQRQLDILREQYGLNEEGANIDSLTAAQRHRLARKTRNLSAAQKRYDTHDAAHAVRKSKMEGRLTTVNTKAETSRQATTEKYFAKRTAALGRKEARRALREAGANHAEAYLEARKHIPQEILQQVGHILLTKQYHERGTSHLPEAQALAEKRLAEHGNNVINARNERDILNNRHAKNVAIRERLQNLIGEGGTEQTRLNQLDGKIQEVASIDPVEENEAILDTFIEDCRLPYATFGLDVAGKKQVIIEKLHQSYYEQEVHMNEIEAYIADLDTSIDTDETQIKTLSEWLDAPESTDDDTELISPAELHTNRLVGDLKTVQRSLEHARVSQQALSMQGGNILSKALNPDQSSVQQ